MNQVLKNLKNFYSSNKVLSIGILFLIFALVATVSILFYLNLSNKQNNNFTETDSFIKQEDYNFSNNDIFNLQENSLDYDTAKKVYNNFLKKNENIITTLKPNIYQIEAIKIDNNSFVKTTYEQKLGSKKCKTNTDKNEDIYLNSKITSLLYRDNDNLYYKEVYNHPELGDFYTYIKFDNFKDKVTEIIRYNGGDYAVKTYNKDLEVSDDKYSEYTIEDTNIPNGVKVLTKNINNQEFYIIRFEDYNFDCNTGKYSSSSSGNTIIQDFYLDKNSYQVVKFISYVKSDFDAKFDLINEITVKTLEQQNVNFENIKSNFKLDANVEIKEINLSNSQQDYSDNDKKKIFDSLNISFIRPINGNIEMGYVHINTDNIDAKLNKLISDRNFFPKGKLGDELYNNSLNNTDLYLSRLKITYIFSVDNKIAWDVSVYSSFKSIDEYLSSSTKENIYKFNKNFSGKNLEVARVKVGNNTISAAEKYRYILFYNGYIYDFDVYNQEDGNTITDISNYDIGIFDKGSKEFNLLRDFVYNSL